MIRKFYFYTLLISLSFILIFGISWLNSRSILALQNHGSWKVLDNRSLYNYFKENEGQKYFRVISITEDPKPTFLYLNEINTFDGLRYNHSINKSLFFSISLKISPNNLSKVRHQIRDHTNIDYKMLAMANIKYILSSKKIINKNLIFKEKILITKNIHIFIYENNVQSWGHIFIPNGLRNSKHNISNPNYYLDLKQLGFRELLINKGTENKKFDIKIIDYKFKNNIYSIFLNGEPGPLVINQLLGNNILATCNNKKLKISIVNGIMTKINIPKDCTFLSVDIN